ncbi:MAG: hypothetical protein LC623_02470 [Halobacteriales archaeon]|nr:hypothetical protein [Halobacteriales archaeon]
MAMSAKSSRLRHGKVPPWFQMAPTCTGSSVSRSTAHDAPASSDWAR